MTAGGGGTDPTGPGGGKNDDRHHLRLYNDSHCRERGGCRFYSGRLSGAQ